MANVFAIARLDHVGSPGGLALGPTSFAPADLIADAETRFRAAHPEHPLRVEVEGELPDVEGDATLVRRVLDNLLDNAAAYGETRLPIELAARAVDEGEALEIEVRDRGAGVSDADLERLFEPFFRSDRSRSRSTGGVGLGLTLCRRIVEAHGGRIAAEKRAGGGLTMRVWLPRSRTATAPAAVSRRPRPPSEGPTAPGT